MKRKKFAAFAQVPLMKKARKPILGVRFMQISGITNSPLIPLPKTSLSQTGKSATDQAVINFSPDSFSSLVKEASQMPEVRSEVVDAFKSRIQSGGYPSQADLAGLADVIGGGILHEALSGSSL